MNPNPVDLQPTATAVDSPLTALDTAFADFLSDSQPSPDPRHRLLAALTSHQYGRGHACLDLQLLADFGVAALGWDARLQDTLPVDLVATARDMPWISGPGSPLVLDGPRLYLRRNWQAEQAIRASITARLAQPCPVPDRLKQAIDSLFPALPGLSGDEAGSLPDWQKIACALAARGRFTLITGGPGTGKTTTVVRLLALLQSQAVQTGKPLRMALAAPTGKAAARLGESIAHAIQKLPEVMRSHIPVQALTLHKLLQVRSSIQASAPPALALDVVVVDEASMIDLELMARLLAAVPLSTSLILLGDKDQLASVEAGAVMGQLCDGAELGDYTPDTVQWVHTQCGEHLEAWSGTGSALAQHTVMLRQSRRFAADSVIGQWAGAVNAGDRQQVQALWSATPRWSSSEPMSVTRLEPRTNVDRHLTDRVRAGWGVWLAGLASLGQGHVLVNRSAADLPAQPLDDARVLSLLGAFGKFQVLCAMREGPWGVTALNRAISRALGFPLDGWYAGRPVMVTRNDYHLNLMNGDVGLCLPTAQGLRVAFAQGGEVRWVLPSRLDAVETVLAMTVHKSQGSEFDQVALVLPDKMAPVLTRELLYTGLTRAKQALTLVVPQAGVLRQAVATKTLRSGGLTGV
jgi:exodeoxyribonuclease V alpha subunit